MVGLRKSRTGCNPWALRLLHFLPRGLAQLAEDFDGVDAGVVAVVPGDLVGVVADRGHRGRLRRAGAGNFLRAEDVERVRRLLALLSAGGAGALPAQLDPAEAVAPA